MKQRFPSNGLDRSMQILSPVKVGKLTLCLIPPVKSLDAVLLCYGCEGRYGAVIASKRARKSCGGVEGKLRSTMPILSSTCKVLKTTCRDDRIYVPGSKIHVRRQRNRRSASGEVLAVLQRRAVLLRVFSSAPLEDYLV